MTDPPAHSANASPGTVVDLSPELAIIVRRWSRRRGNLIMVLHDVQGHHGYVPWDVAKEVARVMHVPLARIFEVLTFYHYFKLRPPGRFITSVCQGTACHLKGGGEVYDAFRQALGVGEGQTTADGQFHLQTVRCLGCCGLAPVVMINGRVHVRCTAATVSSLIADCRGEAATAVQET